LGDQVQAKALPSELVWGMRSAVHRGFRKRVSRARYFPAAAVLLAPTSEKEKWLETFSHFLPFTST
jgi:hypothetical protein